jgi:flagellar motor switch protein FliN
VTKGFAITPAPLTVTADNKAKTYGDADPAFTASITGLQNGDEASAITYTLARETGENVGEYIITPSGDALQGSYIVSYETGTFTITETAAVPVVKKAPKEITGLVYTGSPQTLVEPGEAENGTMWYAVTDNTATAAPTFDGDDTSVQNKKWSTSIPSKTNAGTYYVWYKAVDNGNHTESKPDKVEVKIGESGSPSGGGTPAAGGGAAGGGGGAPAGGDDSMASLGMDALNGMGLGADPAAQLGMGAAAMGGGAQMGGMPNMTMGGGMQQNMGMPNMGMGGMQQNMNMGMGAMGGMQMPANMGVNMGMNVPNVQSLQFPNLASGMSSGEQGNIGLIMDVFMEMTVELGRTKRSIKDILGMGEGTIIELDKLAGEPVDILVNHKKIAKGEVVVIDENFGVRVTEILSPMERVSDIN